MLTPKLKQACDIDFHYRMLLQSLKLNENGMGPHEINERRNTFHAGFACAFTLQVKLVAAQTDEVAEEMMQELSNNVLAWVQCVIPKDDSQN